MKIRTSSRHPNVCSDISLERLGITQKVSGYSHIDTKGCFFFLSLTFFNLFLYLINVWRRGLSLLKWAKMLKPNHSGILWVKVRLCCIFVFIYLYINTYIVYCKATLKTLDNELFLVHELNIAQQCALVLHCTCLSHF